MLLRKDVFNLEDAKRFSALVEAGVRQMAGACSHSTAVLVQRLKLV